MRTLSKKEKCGNEVFYTILMSTDTRAFPTHTHTHTMQGYKEIEMSDDLKPLTFYSVQTGDTVLVRW